MWNGSYFHKVSLKSLGLWIQLQHVSMHCSNPIASYKKFQVLHTNSIHDVAVNFCGCEQALPHHVQVLRHGLYPSSQAIVKTCATFQLLCHLHLLALTSKGSTYDFYHALEKSTNNNGVIPPSRYCTLLCMVLQWRHLKMLERGGRGHDLMGIEGTQSGELTVLCPLCPHPGINLPEGWEDVLIEKRSVYLHTLYFLDLICSQIPLPTCNLHGCQLPPEELACLILLCWSWPGYWYGIYGGSNSIWVICVELGEWCWCTCFSFACLLLIIWLLL